MNQPIRQLAETLRGCRFAMVAIVLASALVNILYLTGALYMMEVYDRVLTSRSVPTLIGLSVLALSLFAFQGILDLLRGRLLIRIGQWMGDRLAPRVYDLIGKLTLRGGAAADALQPIRDSDQIRSFLSSAGPLALLDLPWIPLYIAICYLMHFWLGVTASVGAVILVSLTLLTDALTRKLTRQSNTLGAKRAAIAEASRRNAEALHAMGIAARVGKLWHQVNGKYLDSHQRASDITGGLGALSKVARLALQSAVLGVGAYLVIHQEASPGIIIAGSIISGRALAPVDLAIANWRGFVAFRQSWGRLKELLRSSLIADQQMALPVPRSNLVVEDVSLVPRGAKGAVVHDISFALQSGSGLGIIGPSAAGKSCLARALVGVWPPARGTIRIDGAALDQWDPNALSQHVGYLPQDVELLAGTVAQNIARFEENPDAETIVEAANAASVHEMILRLPNGYDTEIGEGGAFLSAGQRQRIALARALFRKPFLLVLDEPNSNLDSEGDEALTRAILQTRERGGIAVVIAHRPSALAGVDMMMAMAHGHVHLLGTKEEILAKLRRATETTQVAPLRMVEAS